jgi:hypothetical protein
MKEMEYTREFIIDVPDDVEDVNLWVKERQEQISEAADDHGCPWLGSDEEEGWPDGTDRMVVGEDDVEGYPEVEIGGGE